MSENDAKGRFGISLFISKIMASGAFPNLFDFHNPIFTKHSITTPQIRPVDLLFPHIFLSGSGQRQELFSGPGESINIFHKIAL